MDIARGYRRAMAKAMTAAAAIPHFHYMEEIEVNKLVELKSSLSGSGLLKPGAKLTYLPFLIKSLSTALQKYPVMNSTVNEEATEICLKGAAKSFSLLKRLLWILHILPLHYCQISPSSLLCHVLYSTSSLLQSPPEISNMNVCGSIGI